MLISYSTLCKKYNILPKGVIHIGANVGQEASDYYSNGVEHSIWIEADPGLIPSLIDHIHSYDNHLVFNSCLTDQDDDEVTLHIANNGGQSSSILDLSYHSIAHPEVVYVRDTVIKTQRLDSLLGRYDINIEDYPFINIDIQGAELLCLKGFGDLLHKVKYLYVEVNDKELYSGCALFPELCDYIAQYGFTLREKVMAGNFQWGDAFFINNNIT